MSTGASHGQRSGREGEAGAPGNGNWAWSGSCSSPTFVTSVSFRPPPPCSHGPQISVWLPVLPGAPMRCRPTKEATEPWHLPPATVGVREQS